ncbi:hypothetical protein KSP39_PZI005852 [Platanthera zijinensis]|uniref:Uncharacterized protein n=1 Tax=Platanthera zijinensis TaxID=2320716 RepID=A0AAP0GAN7_9ASPA
MEESKEERNVKAPNLLERAKEKMEAVMHREKTHRKETHGTSDEIDENTPIEKVKGPNILERAKEEFQAIKGSVRPKRGHGDEHEGEKSGGFMECLGRGFQKFCSPSNGKKD